MIKAHLFGRQFDGPEGCFALACNHLVRLSFPRVVVSILVQMQLIGWVANRVRRVWICKVKIVGASQQDCGKSGLQSEE